MYSKFEKLKIYIKSLKSVAVAYSGGVDSTFLLKVCSMILGNNCIAITAKSPLIPDYEIQEATEFCKIENIRQIIFEYNPLKMENFVSNPKNRCYICKSEFMKRVLEISKENNIQNVFEGSNFDDLKDFRPGFKAVQELNILSPLCDFGFTKAEIRALSKELKLKTHSKPALACLATRIPYKDKITKEKLKTIEHAEKILFNSGFNQVRVRLHKDIARIEIAQAEFDKIIEKNIRDTIISEFKKLGFKYIALDLAGYRTGSMNEIINN